MAHRKQIRRFWFSACLLAAVIAVPGWLTWNWLRQFQRDNALVQAVVQNDTPAALELLAQGANPNIRQSAQQTPPTLLQAFRLMLRLKKPPVQDGLPVLLLAAQQGNDTMMRALAAKGANVNVADKEGGTPLMWAISKHDDKATVQKLLEKGANVNAGKTYGATVLMCAVEKHDAALVRALLDRGADVRLPAYNGDKWMPLAQAYEDKQDAIVDMLLAQGADPNVCIGSYADRHPLLAVAVERGDWKYFRVFLAHHADANRSTRAISPLSAAAEKGQMEMARILLVHGADVNEPTWMGFTAFFAAGTYKMKTFLLSKGANIEATNYHSRTSLMWAAEAGNQEEIRYLRAHGANIYNRDIYGMNTVFLALKYPSLVRMLLKAGVTPNVATTYQDCGQWRTAGMTPLMEAAKEGYTETAKLLLAYGADMAPKDSAGRSALGYARQSNHPQIVRLLRQAGASRRHRKRQ